MPGWAFVSALLAVAGVIALITQPPPFGFVLVLAAIVSAVAGAVVRPDRR